MTIALVAGIGSSSMRLAGMLFFGGFFLAAFLAIRYAHVSRVRRGFLGGFFAVLVVVALVAPVQPLPMIQWHKFSNPVPQEETVYQLRVVDADGRELRYDSDATLEVDGVYLHRMLDDLVEAEPAEQREIGRHLLEKAREYRVRLANPRPSRFFRYPPGGLFGRWTAEKLAEYDEFVGLRVYEMTAETSPDGRTIVDTEEVLVLELQFDHPAQDVSPEATTDAIRSDRESSTAYAIRSDRGFVAPGVTE